MIVCCDTSVLVAAAWQRHPRHPQAGAVLRRVKGGLDQGCVAAHSLVESYSVLTRLPVTPRITPTEAWRILQENVRPHFQVLHLKPEDYWLLLERLAGRGLAGGVVYDAVLLQTADPVPWERLYTFNVEEFRRLSPGKASQIVAP